MFYFLDRCAWWALKVCNGGVVFCGCSVVVVVGGARWARRYTVRCVFSKAVASFVGKFVFFLFCDALRRRIGKLGDLHVGMARDVMSVVSCVVK